MTRRRRIIGRNIPEADFLKLFGSVCRVQGKGEAVSRRN